jgi:hypothetical protein
MKRRQFYSETASRRALASAVFARRIQQHLRSLLGLSPFNLAQPDVLLNRDQRERATAFFRSPLTGAEVPGDWPSGTACGICPALL